jgi:TonB family protein
MTRLQRIVCSMVVAGLCWGVDAAAADLETAKALYASASYEEALKELDAVEDHTNADVVDQYRALCFLALDRQRDAESSLERIVLRSPQYRIDAATVSPKLVDLYKQVRVKLLPVVARRLYADAKGQYDLAMYMQARGGFVRLLDLLEEAGAAGAGDSVSDLAQLANGFLELTNLALARAKEPPAVTVEAALPPSREAPLADARPEPVAAAAPPPPGAPTAAAAPGSPAPETPMPMLEMSPVFSAADAGVVPPVAVDRDLPRWTPPPGSQETVRGALEIVVSEAGVVESVAVASSISPAYDRALLAAARDWRFRPAMRQGSPVKFRLLFNIVLSPPARR